MKAANGFDFRGHALALLFGAGGGAAFFALGMPLAWMLGSMIVVTALALCGMRPSIHHQLRAVMVAVLGVFLGSAFTPDVVGRALQWAQALAVLASYIVAGSGLVYLYLRRVGGFDAVTAYFSSTPGGLGEMVIASEEMGGDSRRVSLVHTTRIIIIVIVIPFWFRLAMDVDVPSLMPPTPGVEAQSLDWAILIGCAAVGWPLAHFCRVPAAALVGPMILSALTHFTGLTEVKPPAVPVAAAQLVIGAAVGCRFVGMALSLVWRTVRVAFVSTLVLLGLGVVMTLIFSNMIGVEPEAMALVLAPGGLAEMSLIALALGVDTAFVSTMHVCRIVIIVILGPSLYRLLGPRRRRYS